MIGVEKTVISQYSNSPIINQIIANINECLDPRANLKAFYDTVINIYTAQGFGLDIWGRIVGVERNFDTGVITSDEYYRKVILAKAIANITQTNAKSLNILLRNFFGTARGAVYVNDIGNMQMEVIANFELTALEISILTTSGIFPRPAGVQLFIVTHPYPAFGFYEMGLNTTPFDEAPFIGG